MCTLTFIGTKNGFCLTSNRDEKVSRGQAIPPKKYVINGKTITFPKDSVAGGTWVAHDEQAILDYLNGTISDRYFKTKRRTDKNVKTAQEEVNKVVEEALGTNLFSQLNLNIED